MKLRDAKPQRWLTVDSHARTGPGDPERYDEYGYDGPPAAADQAAVRARLRAEEAEYVRLRDQHRMAA